MVLRIKIDNLNHSYIGDEYKDLIDDIFKVRLRDGDMHLKVFDNKKRGLRNIVNNYLEKQDVDVDNRLFNFEKSIKNSSDVDNRIHRIIGDYNPQTKSEYEYKKKSS